MITIMFSLNIAGCRDAVSRRARYRAEDSRVFIRVARGEKGMQGVCRNPGDTGLGLAELRVRLRDNGWLVDWHGCGLEERIGQVGVEADTAC
jgi:hypothetical protein